MEKKLVWIDSLTNETLEMAGEYGYNIAEKTDEFLNWGMGRIIRRAVTTWKNTSYKTRDYEATNILAAVGNKPATGNWIEDNSFDLSKLNKLWIQDGTQYYGYL